MSLPKLKIGLVGAGRMGSFHLEKLKAHSGVELSGVFDKNCDLMTATFEELLFESDALVIASPTPTHFGYAKMALENGLHVFLEKPLCETINDGVELVRLSEQRQRVLQTGFVERYRWLALSKALPKDYLSRPNLIATERTATSPSREPGLDVVMDLMIHDIDSVLWLIQEPPVSIVAEGLSLGLTEIDLAHARLEFPSGAVAHLKAQWGMPVRRRETHVAWPKKQLTHDMLSGKCHLLVEGKSHEMSLEVGDPLADQLDCFVRSIRENMPVVVSGSDGLKALEVCGDIRQKINQRVKEKPRLSLRERKFLSKFWEEYAH